MSNCVVSWLFFTYLCDLSRNWLSWPAADLVTIFIMWRSHAPCRRFTKGRWAGKQVATPTLEGIARAKSLSSLISPSDYQVLTRPAQDKIHVDDNIQTLLFTVPHLKYRGRIQSEEFITIKCLQPNNPGFLCGDFPYSWIIFSSWKCWLFWLHQF